ncbi:hypothetical protein MPNT_60046 [Candidatus Methylacidithermus pantelleriae]|uniref:Uncharacterized protein n=1 Tax=Candidatus Methylacidithermus pantelleriae TaxID=2744239 RepID=A0A8J2BVZ7_9BACT|nr:hypothetical protein MPNT_60046 [Candidatus Methylacidithermus pantelleriae]
MARRFRSTVLREDAKPMRAQLREKEAGQRCVIVDVAGNCG